MAEKFVPYIPPEETIPELTAKALILGIVLAFIMTAFFTHGTTSILNTINTIVFKLRT